MTAVTLVLAVVASLAALLLTPSRALAVYCATLVLYPAALTLQIGSADFSLSRICILAVLVNATVRSQRHRSFQWAWIDVFILASWALGFVALLTTFPGVAIERHSGTFFDTILPYLAARLIVTSQEELLIVIESLALLAVPILVLAIWQMFTGSNPIGFLSRYYSFGMQWDRVEHHNVRLGLHRAAVTFSHAISLGLFYALVGTTTLSLWKQHVWSRPAVAVVLGIAALGLFTSLSSGPLLALVGAAFVFLVYADWRLALALSGLAIVSIVCMSAYSGEPYSEVLTDFAYDPVSAEFRFGLLRNVLNGGMSGHWWTGYGYVGMGPGTDNTEFFWRKQDMVNIYIAILVRTGLLGLLPFLVANALYYLHLGQAIRLAPTREASWMAWCLLATMVGWNVAMLSVSPLATILQLLYLFIAISTNMPTIVTVKAPRAS